MLTFETAAVQGVAGIIDKLTVRTAPDIHNARAHIFLLYRTYLSKKLFTSSPLLTHSHRVKQVEFWLWSQERYW